LQTASVGGAEPIPELKYTCDEQANDYDEKILKLPARVEAIKSLMSELSSFSDAAWWTADTVDLSVCDFTKSRAHWQQRSVALLPVRVLVLVIWKRSHATHVDTRSLLSN
jgi:hypothetical protein